MASANVTDELGVANLALQRIGVKAVADIDGTDKAAVAANRILADTRDELCRMFPWVCAVTREALSTTAISTSAFAYQHTMASAALRILEIVDIEGAENVPYRIEGRHVLTDRSSGYLRYVQQVATVSDWDPLLLTAIECRMASKLAVWLAGDLQLAAAMHQELVQILGIAMQVKAIEQHEDNVEVLALLRDQYAPLLLGRAKVVE